MPSATVSYWVVVIVGVVNETAAREPSLFNKRVDMLGLEPTTLY